VKVLADRNFNLHSKSSEGGLVHVAKRRWKTVPDDVAEEPGFQSLVDNGHIVVAKENTPLLVEENEEVPEDEDQDDDEKDEDEDQS